MAWLDDRAWCHPKLTDLTDKQFRVYVNGLAYSSGMGTRGHLTAAQQRILGSNTTTRNALISAGVWDERPDGAVYIHDWDEHNAKRDARRDRDRERKRSLRKRDSADLSAGQARGQSTGTSTRQSTGTSQGTSPGTARGETVDGSDREEEQPSSSLPHHAQLAALTATQPLTDTLNDIFGPPTSGPEHTERQDCIRHYTDLQATHDEVARRAANYRTHYPNMAFTPRALLKHWTISDKPKVTIADPNRRTKDERVVSQIRDRQQRWGYGIGETDKPALNPASGDNQ